jgi:hypothetical protein
MPPTFAPQAVVVRDRGGPKAVARSERFGFDLEEAALRAAAKFGDRPAGVRCPDAVFACRLAPDAVAVVHVADLGDGSDPPLGFRFLVLPRVVGDVFAWADAYPPDWSARGPLPEPELILVADPRPTVAELQELLKAGDSALLLGATQALLDGCKVRLDADAGAVVRGVGRLLPERARADLWPATFAFSAELGFDLVATPEPAAGYLSADQARDYPEGRYELALQIAVEAGDQAAVNQLFARRTSRETLRLAAGIVLFMMASAVVLKLIG